MEATADARPKRPGYENGPVTKPPDWHRLVVWDVLLNGLTTGLFLVAALAELAAPAAFAPLARWAYPLALVWLTLDLTCLVFDLGDPWRFHHMLRVFKPSSPMSLGTWCLTAYSAPLTAVVALDLLFAEGPTLAWVRRTLLFVGLLPALGSAVYKGVLFSTTAQPGWKDARWLGAYFANSAVVLGCAQLLLLALAFDAARVGVLRTALLVLVAVHAVPLGLLLGELRPTLMRAYSRRDLGPLLALSLGGSVLLPLALLPLGHPLLAAGAAVAAVGGAYVVRSAVVSLPHAVAAAARGASSV